MKIIIYDGHPMMRDGLTQLVKKRGDVVITSTSDALKLVAAVSWSDADLIIIDPVTLPASALDDLRLRGKGEQPVPCLVYSASESAAYLLRGANITLLGCINKAYCEKAINEALDGLSKGKSLALPLPSPALALCENLQADRLLLAALTRRELQILRQLGSGKSNKMIASEMGLSNKTISTYKRSIMYKMKTEHFSALIDFARRSGF